MYLIKDGFIFVTIRCEKCGKEHFIDRLSVKFPSEGGCILRNPIQCKCGNISEKHIFKKAYDPSQPIKCPKCGSTQLSADKKGFGLGKAAAGAILAGPVGLVGGLFGSKDVVITCLSCGAKFNPGEGN